MAMDDDERRRRKSYFPAANRGYSMDPRFTGSLQPSPTGTYFNPARYGSDLSPRQLATARRNLANTYTQDLEFNRLANPRYQTTQDTGATSTAQFGTGRATPATTQAYARQYGRPIGGGLTTFETPSGGSITYRPSGRTLAGGAAPTVAPGSQDLSQPLAAANFDYGAAWRQGFGTGRSPYPQRQEPFNPTIGNVANLALSQFEPSRGYQRLMGLVGLGANAYNSVANMFRGNQQPPAQRPVSQSYANQPYQDNGPRRYFDY